jgi:hypothetical protein
MRWVNRSSGLQIALLRQIHFSSALMPACNTGVYFVGGSGFRLKSVRPTFVQAKSTHSRFVVAFSGATRANQPKESRTVIRSSAHHQLSVAESV